MAGGLDDGIHSNSSNVSSDLMLTVPISASSLEKIVDGSDSASLSSDFM